MNSGPGLTSLSSWRSASVFCLFPFWATCSSKPRRDASSCSGTQTSAPPPRGGLRSAPWGCWWETARCRLSATRRHTGRISGNARRSKDGRPTPTRLPDVCKPLPPGRRRKTPICRRWSLWKKKIKSSLSHFSGCSGNKHGPSIFPTEELSHHVSPTDVIVLCQPTISPTLTLRVQSWHLVKHYKMIVK